MPVFKKSDNKFRKIQTLVFSAEVSKNKHEFVELHLTAIRAQNTPYITLNSICRLCKIEHERALDFCALTGIDCHYAENLGSVVLTYKSAINFFGSFCDRDGTQPHLKLLESVFIALKTRDIQNKVNQVLNIKASIKSYKEKPLTTSGDYLCCGTCSFKPIARARFEV